MRRLIYCIVFFSFILLNANAQSIRQSFSAIKSAIVKVETEKSTIESEFSYDGNTYGKVRLNVNTSNTKGSGSNVSYYWNMADIDPNTVVRYVKGKLMSVKIAVRNKQDFIREVEDGKVKYTSDISIPVNNADAADVLINEIKTSIELANLGKMKWNTLSSAMNWIKMHVTDQSVGGKSYTQSLNFFPLQNNMVKFKQLVTTSKGNVTDNVYEFYINDLFENTVNFKISGDKLEVELKTIGSNKLIKHIEGGKRSTYVSEFSIYNEDVDIARNMVIAFQTAISKYESNKKSYQSVSSALSFIESNVKDIEDGDEVIQQSLKSDKSGLFEAVFNLKTTNKKGVTKEEEFKFFWDHIDGNFLNVDVSRDKLYLVLKTTANKKYISHTIDGEPQSLDNELKIEINDLGDARNMIDALEYAIPLCEAKVPEFKTRIKAINWLKENISEISSEDDTYEQLFEINNSLYIVNVNSSDSKGRSEQIRYEFYPFTLEKNLTQIEIKSKDVLLKLGTKYKNEYVRYIDDGVLKKYTDEVTIKCKNVIEAQIMKDAFICIIENTPELGDFSSASQARAFLLSNVEKVEIPGVTFDQSLTNKADDNCVLLFAYDKISSKGKADSHLYEFNLGYLYPEQIKLNVKSKELFIEAFTRGKQKLIKSYKNNELQNYTNTFRIQVDDVLKGLRLEIAMKMLADNCEK